jgi:Fe-S cluster assembly iron-binding protein IscA
VSVRITPAALGVLRRSLELAGSDPGEVGVRLRRAGGEVRPRFEAEPRPDDEVVEVEGLRVFVAREIVDELGEVEVDISEEHEQIVVRRAG